MIVLDTHALLWWVSGDDRLSQKAQDAIERELHAEEGEILISIISAWEIALLVEKDRLSLSMGIDDWLDTVEEIEAVRFVSIGISIAIESTRLPGECHKDPADRMIVSLARYFNVDLVTADEKIIAYKHVRTIW